MGSAWPEARREALRALIPPEAIDLASWIEKELVLPSNVSALPGAMRLHAHQRGVCDAISDPSIETVSLCKPVRIGFSTLLIATVANYVANDPSNVMILLPTDDDCRDFMVSDLGPIFDATPSLRGSLVAETDEKNRNTMTSKRFPGGSLKCLAARSPRNLRRHNVRVLCCDEIDAMVVTVEGDALQLAIRRTLSFSNRKIIMGSTPALKAESAILKAYGQGDQRIFEICCPSCSAWSEITWSDIKWDEGKPETAQWCCPSCGVFHNEDHKPAMVHGGRWRALAPDVKGHASFRINALVSLLPNACWGRLAREFIDAKHLADRGDTSSLQTFVNCVLAQGWAGPGETINESMLTTMIEEFNLDSIPPVAMYLCAGVDVQADRLEVSICGFDADGVCHVLSHQRIWGSPDDAELWQELSHLLGMKWHHPFGASIGITATCIDSGYATEKVYDYCFARGPQRIYATKGLPGNRPAIQRSVDKVVRGKSTRNSGRLWLVGTHVIKTMLFSRLQSGKLLRFSDRLDSDYFEQLSSERITYVYRAGRRFPKFEQISGRENHAFDTLVYAHAARASLTINNWRAREEALRGRDSVQRESMGKRLFEAYGQKPKPELLP